MMVNSDSFRGGPEIVIINHRSHISLVLKKKFGQYIPW